ncbi:MAG: PAAR domain-containing protein [Proteobacteria bacterium]|nr:PAAR domain-containing protein [Pseudomonadota bacterium]
MCIRNLAVLAVVALMGSTSAFAQSQPAPATPGVITDGARGVSIGGLPAATAGDRTTNGDAVVKGSSNVFINGKPAVTVGDTTGCGGVVVSGSNGVFINGKPVARTGDVTTGCDKK